MNTELYSPSLRRRYEASLKAGARETPNFWPMGCGGAANAFLVLIGPSMGRAPTAEVGAVGGANRPVGYPRNLGPEAMNFDWGDHRKARWTRLCAAILGDDSHARTLTALLNLDWRHSTNERLIPDESLRGGWTDHIWPLLPQVRPRIVCALTNRTWNIVVPTIESLQIPMAECPFKLARNPIRFRIPGCNFSTWLVKPHNHPSRPLSNEQIDELGRACQWFLAKDVSKKA